MPYGLTLDQVSKVSQPLPMKRAWGSLTSLTEMPQYSMYRMDISAGVAQPLHFFTEGQYQAFLESGDLVVRSLDESGRLTAGLVDGGAVLSLPRFYVHGFASFSGAVVYLFGPRGAEGLREILVETEEEASAAIGALTGKQLGHLGHPTTDVREKYWGRIETILSSDVAAKRILMLKGGQSSLEFHVEKHESYYIHSGMLRVGLRIGRAENHSIVMKAGESYDVGPGVMHMRMGLEDTVIIEVSTRDSDSDSYLVEDGQTYRHIDITLQPSATEKQEQPA